MMTLALQDLRDPQLSPNPGSNPLLLGRIYRGSPRNELEARRRCLTGEKKNHVKEKKKKLLQPINQYIKRRAACEMPISMYCVR